MNSKILIIAAHPDDEILGCAGTLARLIKEGCEALTLILGEGIASRYNKTNIKEIGEEIEKLKCQAKRANEIIGVKNVSLCNFPDNSFDTKSFLDIVKVVEGVKMEYKPDIVFTHYENDLNIDHEITFRAAITATRPTRGETVKEIYSFEVISSTEWRYPNSFCPDVFFDISETLDLKLKAMSEYETELRNFPHPRSLENIKLNAKHWGVRVGLKYAEAFKTIRAIK